MHPRFIHNDHLLGATKERVEAVSLYGRGVFTTLAIHNHQPFLWAEHWARLAEHAPRASVGKIEFDERSGRAMLARLSEAIKVKEGRARVTVLATTERGVWKVKATGDRKTDLLVMTGEARAPAAERLRPTHFPHLRHTPFP